MYRPQGVVSAMVTSVDAKGQVDETGIRKNIDFQVKAGIKSIVMLGGTGEPLSMTPEERKRTMEASIAAVAGRLKVVIGALVGNPTEVARDIENAAKAGADACMVTTTPFVRPHERDVRRLLTELAGNSPLPLIVFNVPSRSGFLMSSKLICDLARDVEKIVAVKESSRDIALFSDVRAGTDISFSMLQGSDALFLPSLALGGDGGILAAAAVFPELVLAIQTAATGGDLRTARARHFQLMELVHLLYEASHPGPLKLAIELRGVPVGKTRPPLYDLTKDHQTRINRCVEKLLQSEELIATA